MPSRMYRGRVMQGTDGRLSLVAAVVAAAVVAGALGWFGGRASTIRERRRLAEMARRDGLTGLLNRAGFAAVAGAALASSRGRAAVMIVDVDGFKRVNDMHGHAAGDAVLAELAGELVRCVSVWGGVVGRLGGDEFGVLLSHRPMDVGGAAEAVVRALNRTCLVPVESGYRRIPVSATVGVSVVEASGSADLDLLVRIADSAMYAAKRNRAGWSVRGGGADPGAAGPAAARARTADGAQRPRARNDGRGREGSAGRLAAMGWPRPGLHRVVRRRLTVPRGAPLARP